MAIRLFPLTLILAACTGTPQTEFPVDASITPLEVIVPPATYVSPPQFTSFSVTNNMGSTLYISPAVPKGDLADLLVINVPPYTQVSPGQVKPVQITLDNRPWRWRTGEFTATLPFEVRYFFSGQSPDEAEDPSSTESPISVGDVLSLTVKFSINCDLDDDGQDSVRCGGTDCDDQRASTYLGADETCDGRDQDCDGAIDNDAVDARTWWLDSDGDQFGQPGSSVDSCARPGVKYVNQGGDCNDNNRFVYPDAFEICGNGLDDNCDGKTDSQDQFTCP